MDQEGNPSPLTSQKIIAFNHALIEECVNFKQIEEDFSPDLLRLAHAKIPAEVCLGQTKFVPIALAASRGKLAVVQWLLALPGYSLDSQSRNDVLQWMRFCENDGSTLREACEHGYTEVVRLWLPFAIDLGLNLNATDNWGRTAFMLACQKGMVEIAHLLLPLLTKEELGRQDIYGQTALMLAAGQGRSAVVSLLLPHLSPEQKSLRDEGGYTAFIAACDCGDSATIQRFLMDSDIDVNACEGRGFSAAMVLLDEMGCSEPSPTGCMGSLIHAKADVDHTSDEGGYGFFHTAVLAGIVDPSLYLLLLDAKADMNALDNDNKTPLQLAQEEVAENGPAVAELLISMGAFARQPKVEDGLSVEDLGLNAEGRAGPANPAA